MTRQPRPPLPAANPPQPQRFRRGKGRRYVPDVVERVRVLIVGTTWPEADIAARTGVGATTVYEWKVRGKWERPEGTPVSSRWVAPGRAGFTRRCREALRRIEEMAIDEVLRLSPQGDDGRVALERAVALVVATRSVLRPAATRSRKVLQQLERLALAEIARLGRPASADPEALEPIRGLAGVVRLKLYRPGAQPQVAP